MEKIKKWIRKAQLTVEDAFKCFDKDFDGYVNKADLKHALVNLLEIEEDSIYQTKLDRLYRLMDFFK